MIGFGWRDVMIELNEQQQALLDGPQPAMIRDPRTGETFVLVRSEIYEKVRASSMAPIAADGTIPLTMISFESPHESW